MSKNVEFKKLGITCSFYSVFMKRFLDILFSFVLIVILLPFMLIFYILTALFIGFPVIFKQARPGKNHKIFYIYKFRTMNNKKDSSGKLLPDDKRVNWFGKFMRRFSFDELPQLFNILKGDMSFVGPRPRLARDMIFYDEEVYNYYQVTPGLTGPTQVSGRNKNTWEQVFEKDVNYTKHITFFGDVKIFIKTLFIVFFCPGETHNHGEEKVKQEYYYGDYLKRIGKITPEQYEYGNKLASLLKIGQSVPYLPELHSTQDLKQKE